MEVIREYHEASRTCFLHVNPDLGNAFFQNRLFEEASKDFSKLRKEETLLVELENTDESKRPSICLVFMVDGNPPSNYTKITDKPGVKRVIATFTQ
jgi:hypothetical protein